MTRGPRPAPFPDTDFGGGARPRSGRWFAGWRTVAITWFFILSLGACVHQRSFHHPAERLTYGTAYTVQRGEGRVDVGLVGRTSEELLGSIDLTYGASKYLQLSTNLAHGAFSIFNVQAKSNFFDGRRVALGAEATAQWIDGSWLWIIPADQREVVGDIRLFRVPLSFHASFPVNPWFQFNSSLTYIHTALDGVIDEDTILAHGDIGGRMLRFAPNAMFYLGHRVALGLGVIVPLYGVAKETVVAEYESEPGVVVGVESDEWRRVPFEAAFSGTTAVEFRMGRYTNIQLYVRYSGLLRALGLPSVLPGINVYWRFGRPRRHGGGVL